jgi:shikimate kinase
MSTKPILAVLAGFRGAGKSYLGKAAAARLGIKYLDLDQLVEQRLGSTINEFVWENGEPLFRAVEQEELIRACGAPDLEGSILALGGGTLDSDENLSFLLSLPCLRIWIDTSEALCRERLEAEPSRLLLKGLDNPEAWSNLWAFRRPRFSKFATHTVSVQDRSFTGEAFGTWLEAVWHSTP